ncbi:NAD-dependent epimerase/dehydratase family protein [Sphingobacterium mizutaii]|uniref:NAD-dependent epimerase/dehydratase family protein n=1 Tax=Sphingobacterium mizutaii TaxID=1010 RepID=UPI0028ACCC08|nr:NAD-dependent epimerase/dehydratase family protein [Sphingobacterium mizutaii]
MQYKRILVTGAAGFIGFHLCKKLAQTGSHVIGLDNINDYYSVSLKFDRLNELGIAKIDSQKWGEKSQSKVFSNFDFIRMNLEDKVGMERIFNEYNFDAVINLGAQAGVRYSLENPAAYIDSNIVGFLNILEGCRNHKIDHLVYASSSSVYGENEKVPFSEVDRVDLPVSLYAATKKSNELMAHSYSHLYKVPTTGLRFFTVYGPWGRPDMAPILFADAIYKDQSIKVFNNGEMSRDFTFIDDIINGIMIALNNKSTNKDNPYQILNIGNGNPVNLLDFIYELEKGFGKLVDKTYLPMQKGDVPRTWADTGKLNKLGYKSSINISEGVPMFIQWYTNYFKKDI